ncbi:MAG: YraN family protein [Prevotella sp.]
MAGHNILGQWGEETAADYLRMKGYTILYQDWKIGHRDIDIIAQKGSDLVVIVEVKTRSKKAVVPGELAVDDKKIHSLTIAANCFVKRFRINCELRFDIIAVSGEPGDYEINHIENAFYPRLYYDRPYKAYRK